MKKIILILSLLGSFNTFAEKGGSSKGGPPSPGKSESDSTAKTLASAVNCPFKSTQKDFNQIKQEVLSTLQNSKNPHCSSYSTFTQDMYNTMQNAENTSVSKYAIKSSESTSSTASSSATPTTPTAPTAPTTGTSSSSSSTTSNILHKPGAEVEKQFYNSLDNFSTNFLTMMDSDTGNECLTSNLKVAMQQSIVQKIGTLANMATSAATGNAVLGSVAGGIVSMVGSVLFKSGPSATESDLNNYRAQMELEDSACIYYQLYPYAGRCYSYSSNAKLPEAQEVCGSKEIETLSPLFALNEALAKIQKNEPGKAKNIRTKTLKEPMETLMDDPNGSGKKITIQNFMKNIQDFYQNTMLVPEIAQSLKSYFASYNKWLADPNEKNYTELQTQINSMPTISDDEKQELGLSAADTTYVPSAFMYIIGRYWKDQVNQAKERKSPLLVLKNIEQQMKFNNLVTGSLKVNFERLQSKQSELKEYDRSIQDTFSAFINAQRPSLINFVKERVKDARETMPVNCGKYKAAAKACLMLAGPFFMSDGAISRPGSEHASKDAGLISMTDGTGYMEGIKTPVRTIGGIKEKPDLGYYDLCNKLQKDDSKQERKWYQKKPDEKKDFHGQALGLIDNKIMDDPMASPSCQAAKKVDLKKLSFEKLTTPIANKSFTEAELAARGGDENMSQCSADLRFNQCQVFKKDLDQMANEAVKKIEGCENQ